MPKRNRNQNRTMKGGVDLSFFTNSWNSLSRSASDAWSKTKNAASTAYSSGTTPAPVTPIATPSYVPTSAPVVNTSVGGRKRTRKMRGGYTDNTPTTGLASTASPISDIKTAQPHTWVGGKTKRHRKYKHKQIKRHTKSHRRHRK